MSASPVGAERHQCDDLAVVEKQGQRRFTGDEPATRLAILVDSHHLVLPDADPGLVIFRLVGAALFRFGFWRLSQAAPGA